MLMNCNFSTNLFNQEAGGRISPRARPCDGCHAEPSVVYCHADAAYLCASCNTQVHSANHVALRHERVHLCEVCMSAPPVSAKEWSECVVPSQLDVVNEQQQSAYGIRRAERAASITNSIFLSSMEAGIVPDNTIADFSNLTVLTTGGVDLLSDYSFQMPVHLSPMDRAARVLRYKEKRQARKFEKTIRYATRKAYAEATATDQRSLRQKIRCRASSGSYVVIITRSTQ